MVSKTGNIPEKNTKQWKKNESIINKHPGLKAARDIANGFKPSSTISSGINDEQYKEGYDKINWNTKDKPKPKYKVRINGVLQNPDEEE